MTPRVQDLRHFARNTAAAMYTATVWSWFPGNNTWAECSRFFASSLLAVWHMQTLTPSALHSHSPPLSTIVPSPAPCPICRAVSNIRTFWCANPPRHFSAVVSVGSATSLSCSCLRCCGALFAWVNGFASASCGVQGHRWPEASALLIPPPAWKLKLPGLSTSGCASLRFRLYIHTHRMYSTYIHSAVDIPIIYA